MRRGSGLLIGAVAALAVAGAATQLGGLRALWKKKSPFHLERATVDRGLIIGKVTATGTLAALVTVQVGSQVSGRIQDLYADFGSVVKKGQVIARLDPRLFEAAAEQARANRAAAEGNLAQAKAKLVNADKQYARAQELADKKLIAPAELDARAADAAAAHAGVAAAEGDLAQATAQYHQARVNLGYATIVSPIGGVVIARNVDVGQTVAASLQAPTLYTIAEDLRKMQVHAAVSEADVGKLAAEMPATFAVDAYPQEKFDGVIRQIRDAPQTMQNVVTYDAVIEVDNDDLKLKPGMTANVTFVFAEHRNVLRVPGAALRFRPPPELLLAVSGGGGKGAGKKSERKAEKRAEKQAQQKRGGAIDRIRSVWVLHGRESSESLIEIPVEIGVSDGSRVEVSSPDLKEGDVVITDAITRAEHAEAKRNKGQLGATSKTLF
jgi:HlyD family secretion protein